MTTIIIGAGACGLACAVRLKQNKPSQRVIVLERLSRAGKKILATGNGRCNLTNKQADGCKEVTEFFNSLGLVTRQDEEGRVYPYSNMASTVLEVLLTACKKSGVEIITDCTVKEITPDLCVKASTGDYTADSVVIATGGMAQPSLGSDGSGYKILKALGHTITPLSPALVQLTSPSKYPKKLKGNRVKCKMTLLLNDEPAAQDYGEVLFTDYGLSGIVTMNLSRIAGINFEQTEPKRCHAVLDLVTQMSEDEIVNHIKKHGNIAGILGSELNGIITAQADGDAEKIARFAKNWKLIINGTKGFSFAQITCGGADESEFDGFKSKKVNNLYACGEVLNRQYDCGGFNLDFAWRSGIAVADRIAKA